MKIINKFDFLSVGNKNTLTVMWLSILLAIVAVVDVIVSIIVLS